jgi:hypothetical protein
MAVKGRPQVKFTEEQANALSNIVHKSRVSGNESIMDLLKDSVFKCLSNRMRKMEVYGQEGIGLLKEDFEDYMDDVRMAYSRATKVNYPKLATKGQLKEIEFESITFLSKIDDADVVQSLRDHFVEGKSIDLSSDNKEGLKSVSAALESIHKFRDTIVDDELHRKFMNISVASKKVEISQEMTA